MPSSHYFQEPRRQEIYGLVDPRTDQVHYIGRSQNAERRRAAHVRRGNRLGSEGRAKVAWLDELELVSLEPSLRLLEVIKPPFDPPGSYYNQDVYRHTWESYSVDHRGKIKGKRVLSALGLRYQVYVGERELRWILHGLRLYWPLTNAEARVSEETGVTQAFLNQLRHADFDVLSEPLESAAWMSLLPICPQAVRTERAKVRSTGSL